MTFPLMVFGGSIERNTAMSFRYKPSISKAPERKNFNRVVQRSPFILSADMTELTPRVSGRIMKPMIIAQKLTQLACLLKQGKNCSKDSIDELEHRKAPSCHPMSCDNFIVLQALRFFYQFIFFA
jgi:hypothetical protein